MMTRKHYETIAQAINEELVQVILTTSDPHWYFSGCFIGRLADMFEKDNPRFNRERFVAACYKKSLENRNA